MTNPALLRRDPRLRLRTRFDATLAWLRRAAHDPASDRYWWSEGYQLPRRLRLPVWAMASLLFIAAYTFMWSFVHVYIDQRRCGLILNDPLFPFVPYSTRWYWITHEVYTVCTLAALTGLLANALLGDHRPLVIWGTSLGLQALLRSITLLLLPLCRVNVTPGTRAIETAPLLNLGFVSIPWRVWASNDLVFSGHVGEFLLLYWATRSWPPFVRRALVLFQLLQIVALLGTRGHYTIDLVLAVPCALLEYRLALWLLLRFAGRRANVWPAQVHG